jgi:hypothetical protein
MATKRKNTVDHRERKNKRSREDYRAKQHESNAKRGKQMLCADGVWRRNAVQD